MDKCATIAIGGTGARCLEALVHLCAAGLGPDELRVLMVDPDSANGNLVRTRELIENYQLCRSALNPGGGRDIKEFHTQIVYGSDNEVRHLVWSPKDVQDIQNLAELFLYPGQPEWHDLCQTFYSEEELKLIWDMGFRGHASIANPAMELVKKHFDRSPWSDLVGTTANALSTGGHRTFLFASAFGATGAGGFPMIARLLREAARVGAWKGREAYGIGGALLLPYITFETPTDRAKEMHAEARHFLMNTQAALMHYNNAWAKGSPFDAVYFIGARKPDNIDRKDLGGDFALGGKKQVNPAHFMEVMGALSALDFFTRNNRYKSIGEDARECSCYAARGASETSVVWSDIPDVPFDSGENATTRNVQRTLVTYVTAMTALIDFYEPLARGRATEFEKRQHLSAWYHRSFARGSLTDAGSKVALERLRDFARDRLFPWLWQWHQTSVARPVYLFNHEFLNDRAAPGKATPETRHHMFSSMLYQMPEKMRHSRAIDDGYTAIWDAMCREDAPPTLAPLGRLWYLLRHATAKYTELRYNFERRTTSEGGPNESE